MASVEIRSALTEEREDSGLRRHLWTRDEVYRAMAAGVFDGAPKDWLKMELIEGELIEKMPQNRPHSVALTKGRRVLAAAFGEAFYISVQSPMRVSQASEPEPDLMVVPGEPDSYPDHPTGADTALVVEISDSTLRQDRIVKATIYARAGVPEYWVVMLKGRVLEVRRGPLLLPDRDDWEYQSVQILQESDTVTAFGAPNVPILVADLLPAATLE
jgi:Uma2 family endonuclease